MVQKTFMRLLESASSPDQIQIVQFLFDFLENPILRGKSVFG